MPHISGRLRRICAVAFLVLTGTLLASLKIPAQSRPFVADTIVPPHLLNAYTNASLYDFGIADSTVIAFIYYYDGNLSSGNYLIRHNVHNANIDTLFAAISTPSRPANTYYDFDTKGQAISLGYGYVGCGYRTVITSNDGGKNWDTVDIKEPNPDRYSLFYEELKTVKPGAWLVKSLSATWGWLYVTREETFPLLVVERDQHSWVQLFDDDSILVFVADYRPSIVSRCRGMYAPDTAFFQTVRYGQVADALTPLIVPLYPRPPLPYESECPVLRLVESDGERIWFFREWHYKPPIRDMPDAFPTVLYSYDLGTGTVEYEHFFSLPRQPLDAILFADHIFVALDSQLVFRHLDDPPGSPFAPVPGVQVRLENLQVHDGVLYGSRSTGLIIRIRQTSSAVPVSDSESPVSFIAETHGEEIVVVNLKGATSGNVRLELFDAQGRRLAASRIAAGSNSGRVPTPSAPGVYFLRCGGSETSTNLKIIVPLP